MRDSLDQYFPIGICAYKPKTGLYAQIYNGRFF